MLPPQVLYAHMGTLLTPSTQSQIHLQLSALSHCPASRVQDEKWQPEDGEGNWEIPVAARVMGEAAAGENLGATHECLTGCQLDSPVLNIVFRGEWLQLCHCYYYMRYSSSWRSQLRYSCARHCMSLQRKDSGQSIKKEKSYMPHFLHGSLRHRDEVTSLRSCRKPVVEQGLNQKAQH